MKMEIKIIDRTIDEIVLKKFTMNNLELKKSSIYLEYIDDSIKYKNNKDKLDSDQISLMRSISALLSIREFRNGKGYAFKHLNNLISDFLNTSNYYFISNEALSIIEKDFPFHNNIFKKNIFKNYQNIEDYPILPIHKLSNELFSRKLNQTQIYKLLSNLKNKVILANNKNKIFNFDTQNYNLLFQDTADKNKFNLENFIGTKISSKKIKLLNY